MRQIVGMLEIVNVAGTADFELLMQHSLRRRLWAGAVTISSLCVHNTLLLMALPDAPSPKAIWSDKETLELVNILYEKRAEGDGAGNFKPASYKAAADHIAPYLTQGPVKTGVMCKTKWTSVRESLFFLIIFN